ncbi:MAG: DUF1800 domain-containing protein [Candidatus Melainabacteria bacterium]|nr:DUF1800 domain-containing protein [Candidatus Melainabacteria bacterium]
MRRRSILQAGALLTGATMLSGCERGISMLSKRLGGGVPERITLADSPSIDPDFHLLSRAGFGPAPGDLEHVRQSGQAAWINEQLDYEKIDDGLCNLRARRFESLYLKPGDCYDYKKEILRKDMVRHTLLRAVYSKRQLFEVMVDFWRDHLNINLEKGDCIYLKPADDMQVVRKNALGKFRDLIRQSCLSPAMLVYLDGKENRREKESDAPNENYARELLELHTLGVDGGYTQKDVFEAARCLTGWRLRDSWGKGTVYFDKALHDDGEKVVLGTVIPAGGGEKDVEQLLDIVCAHPSTARHIAYKLVRRFVAEDPPRGLVDAVAGHFKCTGGDIKAVVRMILTSPEFATSRGGKIKRPFRFIVSALRATGADTHAHDELTEYLSRMGQTPFQHPTPDGYPEEELPWMGTLLWRWNFAFALAAEKIPGTSVPLDYIYRAFPPNAKDMDPALVFAYLAGRRPGSEELAALEKFAGGDGAKKGEQGLASVFGFVMASPAFQIY